MAYSLVYSQHLNQDFRGHAEQCDYTFTVNLPDQLGSIWTAKKHLNAHIEELQKQGSTILEYYLWEDKTPIFTTDYRVRVVASASPLFWNVIIIGVIVLLGLLVTVWAIKEIKDILEYLGGAGGKTLASMATALAAIAVATVVGIYLVRQPRKGR